MFVCVCKLYKLCKYMHSHIYIYVCTCMFVCMHMFVRVSLNTYLPVPAHVCVVKETIKRENSPPPILLFFKAALIALSSSRFSFHPQPASWVGTLGSQTKWPTEGKGCECHLMVCRDTHCSASFFIKNAFT